MPIFSCKNCVPPERHPGCHGTCPKYLEEIAAYEAQKAAYKKKLEIDHAIYAQRGRAVRKAMKHRREGKFYE